MLNFPYFCAIMIIYKAEGDMMSLPKSCPEFAQHRENQRVLIEDFRLKRVPEILLYRHLEELIGHHFRCFSVPHNEAD